MPRGTSPRTRGKLLSAGRKAQKGRNIPAHAGKTSFVNSAPNWLTEHPRARGENHLPPTRRRRWRGTSPRTRGKRGKKGGFLAAGRNIPAHAGKTPTLVFPATLGEEHPRARGENDIGSGSENSSRGTSPRTRGKRGMSWGFVASWRNIPAHAGKTPSTFTASRPITEHPRARGENTNPPGILYHHIGTSPRTRGKLVSAVQDAFSMGNIPAHAGKTSSLNQSPQPKQEHPRARGENHPKGSGYR